MMHEKESSRDAQWLCSNCGRKHLFHRRGVKKDKGVILECPCGFTISIQRYIELHNVKSKGKRLIKKRYCQ